MLAFSFGSRTFAYKRLAQCLSGFLSALQSFMRVYLEPVVEAEYCAQYVDGIQIAANNATDHTRKIQAVFKCIRQAGLKPTIGKCHFEVRSVEFLSRIISTGKISPRARKIQKFLTKHRVSKSKQDVQLYLTFESYYKNYIHRMAEKLNPLYKMLKGETQTNIFPEFKQAFDSVNKVLCDASELTIKQPIPGEPNVFMANASFRDPGYAFMIEHKPDQKNQSYAKRKPPWRWFGKLLPCATQIVHPLKRNFGNLYGISRVWKLSQGNNKLLIDLTDNKSITCFIQT